MTKKTKNNELKDAEVSVPQSTSDYVKFCSNKPPVPISKHEPFLQKSSSECVVISSSRFSLHVDEDEQLQRFSINM
ncbi:uncharacterized protein V6R79_025046 [Siganus canaliculatus]